MQSAETVLGVLRERDRRHGVITGEPDARKRASPVRREAARKRTRPAGPSPCGPPSSPVVTGTSSGTRRNVIYMTGQDLALICGYVGLADALVTKINAAERRVPHDLAR